MGNDVGLNSDQVKTFLDMVDNILPQHDDDLSEADYYSIENQFKKAEVPLRHLMPYITNCCGQDCTIKPANKCMVFEVGGVYDGITYSGYCKVCKKTYYNSYYKEANQLYYYKSSANLLYFQSTRQSVFEVKLLKATDRDMWVN